MRVTDEEAMNAVYQDLFGEDVDPSVFDLLVDLGVEHRTDVTDTMEVVLRDKLSAGEYDAMWAVLPL